MTDPHDTQDSQETTDEVCHLPVMIEETLEAWRPAEGITFVDGTVGHGGHAAALLERVPEAQLLGIDRDPDALSQARANLADFGPRVHLAQGSYAQLGAHLEAAQFPPQVDGILLDLGLGSHQLDVAERGFSFRFDGPLDMRFDRGDTSRPTAADLLQECDVRELAQMFRQWGEEPQARRAAQAIVRWREHKPLSHTHELVSCLEQALGRGKGRRKSHAVTRCFQALRIAVNEELQQLDTFLDGVLEWLAPGGRLAVISFHSLEDRRIKHSLRDFARGCICPPDLPVCGCGQTPRMRLLSRRGWQATAEEAEANPRARSARLRAAERI